MQVKYAIMKVTKRQRKLQLWTNKVPTTHVEKIMLLCVCKFRDVFKLNCPEMNAVQSDKSNIYEGTAVAANRVSSDGFTWVLSEVWLQ